MKKHISPLRWAAGSILAVGSLLLGHGSMAQAVTGDAPLGEPVHLTLPNHTSYWTSERVGQSYELKVRMSDGRVRRALINHEVDTDEEDRAVPLGLPDVQRHDLKNESLLQFHHKVLSDKTIAVYFMTGVPSCFGARAVLEEKDDSIGLAVVGGTVPDGPEVCILLARDAYFVLRTEKPIGKRTIFALESVDLKRD